MRFIQSYYTDIGIKRKSNQDCIGIFKANTNLGEALLAVVADGMGGYQHGELASKVCIEQMENWFRMQLPRILFSEFNENTIKRSLEYEVNDCNRKLYLYGKEQSIELGSTLTAFLFIGNDYYAIHVGDSRGYIIESPPRQITRDHSLLEQEIEKGMITREEAKQDKRVNILLECVGITPDISMDFYTGKVKRQDVFVICSDGFWHKLEPFEYVRYLSGNVCKNEQTIRMHLNLLVDTVKMRGEKDNVSAIGIIAEENQGDSGKNTFEIVTDIIKTHTELTIGE